MSVKGLVEALYQLNKDQVLTEVEALRNQGLPALTIIDGLQEGMRLVGEQFESENYYLSELIMSANLFKEALDLLETDLSQASSRSKHGMFLMGTVKGDLHDIGKNIVTTVLSCHGFDVMDLGVDVASGQFVKAIEENAIRIVGLSCLLTTAFDSMKQTIDEIQSAGLRENLSIMIGGAPVTQTVCDHVGADAFCTNANEAVEKAKKLIGGAK